MAYPCNGLALKFSCWCSHSTKAEKNTNNGVQKPRRESRRGSKGHTQKKGTPKDFINHVSVDAAVYSKDSIAILAALRLKMNKHEGAFANPEYFDSTTIIIDTIIYNSSLNKIAVFVVAQNPTSRNPYSLSTLPFYYNASCYLGLRVQSNDSLFDLKEFGPRSWNNFEDEAVIKKAMRKFLFLELTTVLDESSQRLFKYNLNDKRFWESPSGWRRTF